jgi:hypothetical protein
LSINAIIKRYNNKNLLPHEFGTIRAGYLYQIFVKQKRISVVILSDSKTFKKYIPLNGHFAANYEVLTFFPCSTVSV